MRGGAEIFTDKLVAELRARGHEADIVTRALSDVAEQAAARERADVAVRRPPARRLAPADLVIATKFPSYLIDHPNKVRVARPPVPPGLRARRDRARAAQRDAASTGRSASGSRPPTGLRWSGRGRSSPRPRTWRGGSARSTGLEAEVLPHPPQELDYRCDRYDPFVLSVGRLDSLKRVDLLLEAAALEPRLRGRRRRRRARPGAARGARLELGLGDRARFAGRVDEAELADLYATCRAVFYAPIDEDFGMVPLEAYRSSKPVVTAADAGGAARLRPRRARPGWVTEPEPRRRRPCRRG